MANKNPTVKWPKGKSGNPNGRPRVQTMTKILGDLMDSSEINLEIKTVFPGKNPGDPPEAETQNFNITSSKNMKYALNVALLAKALKGDTRAATMIINLVVRLLQGDEDDTALADLTQMDAAILADFEAKILNQSSNTANGSQGKGGNDENE